MADAGNLFDLAASISVDSSQSDKVLDNTNKKVHELTDSLKALEAAPKSLYNALGKEMGLDKLKAGVGDLNTKAAGLKAAQKELKATEKAAQQAAAAVKRDLQGALTTLSPTLGGIAGAAGPLAAVAASLVAVGAAAAGIYKLATFSAQLGGEIFDLSQKVNFSAETLSSLKVAAELSGGSLASLSTSLGIFDRNMEEAKEKSSEMAMVFKTLKIETDDNEKALRRAFTVLNDLAGGSQQTAIAMKLFGRSGKEVLGIVKESNGNIDAYIDKMRDLGFVITNDGAKKADQFGDSLTLVRTQLEAVTRQVGQELIPVVSRAASDISTWLRQNQGELQKTAGEIATVVSGLYTLAKIVADMSPLVVIVKIVRQFQDWSAESAQGAAEASARDWGNYKTYQQQVRPSSVNMRNVRTNWGGEGEFVSPGSTVPAAPGTIKFPSRGGGGGGGGGGGAQKDILEGLKTSLMGLQSEYRKLNVELLDSVNLSALAAEKEKILDKVTSSLSLTMRMKISALKDVDQALESAIGALPKKSQDAARALVEQQLAQFKVNRETETSKDLYKMASELASEWKQNIDNARSGADQYDVALQNLEKAFRKHGVALRPEIKNELEFAAALQRSIDKVKALTRERIVGDRPRIINLTPPGQVIDLGGGSYATEGGTGETRGRIATAERQALQEQIEMFNEEMRRLAGNLTSVIDGALRDGFQNGMKAGLASFAQGILEMINSAALDALEKRLAELFTNVFGGSSGKGGGVGAILSGIIGFVGGLFGGGMSAAGGAGASSGSAFGAFAGGFANGGYIPPGQWGVAGEHGPEIVRAGKSGATVAPMGGNSLTVNYYASPGEQPASRTTVAQMARQLNNVQIKARITG